MALTKEQIKEFKEAEKEAENSSDYRYVADEIAEAGDKEWAKKVYKKAEDKTETSDGYLSLVESIYEDNDWAKKLYKKAEKKAENCDDYELLANSIVKILGDKVWAKKVYKQAEEKAEKNFTASRLAFKFISLANCIHKNLGDTEWARKVYKKSADMGGAYSLCIVAKSIHENLGDKEWTKELFMKAEDNAEDSDDFKLIAESILECLGDKKWAALVKKKKKATKKQVLPEIYLSGPELTYEEWRLKEKDINSVQKLNDIISTLTEGEERTAHLVLGKLESSKASNLDRTLVSIEHSDGDDVDFTIKNKGSLIKKPKKGEIVFVCFYYYDHSSHTLNPKKEFKNISLEIKSFQGEAVLTKTDYPNFDIITEDASGGGEYRLEIYCDDGKSFEGTVTNKKDLINEFSEYLVKRKIIKKK
jgi:hypothetical protein